MVFAPSLGYFLSFFLLEFFYLSFEHYFFHTKYLYFFSFHNKRCNGFSFELDYFLFFVLFLLRFHILFLNSIYRTFLVASCNKRPNEFCFYFNLLCVSSPFLLFSVHSFTSYFLLRAKYFRPFAREWINCFCCYFGLRSFFSSYYDFPFLLDVISSTHEIFIHFSYNKWFHDLL